ncbi:MAG: DNA polymerase I [Sphingomonadales bacterium]|nr:DNA polymerase I [Sphingomonadales bacterium]PIX66664.1 MAG: DNA polymerase I [Sphingomonadales bacterium CG_4_10_14_3_um_filter_58_15]NCO49797.1 DNA polymerase I [Sphingomonadales bacterium]NCP01633.1 DNA polymerase I [Sphingomonadales bacterium]NCP27583.1 DNA polymerase I [Sphingomonadales bacterium]
MTDSSDSKPNHLYLVDGSAYIFRAYHRLPPLTNVRGEPVGAVYGYTTMLWKLADELNKADGPTHMAVVLDKAGTSFRNHLYDQYKANRPEAPEDLKPQFPMIRDATRAFSLPLIEEENVEADDMIASYTKAALAEGWKVTIVSSDKDLMQLIEPHGDSRVDMLDTMKNARMNRATVEEKFGVGPEKLGDVLGLMGDSSDNIPGVPGIGPKTASKLINEFGDIESVLAAAPEMKKSKMRDNLIEFAEQARLSRVLVTLREDCPLPDTLDSFLIQDIPDAPLREFLSHHGFNSLLRKLGGDGHAEPQNPDVADSAPAEAIAKLPDAPAIDRSQYECVQTTDGLDQWIARATEQGVCAVDLETDSLESVTARIVGVCLATGPNQACYIPLGHASGDMFGETPEQIGLDEALAKLKPLLEDDAVLKVGQNLKYDMGVLAQHDIRIMPFDDTLVMSFNLDAGLHGHGMDELSKLHLGHECISFKSLTGTGKKAIGFAEVPLDKATEYGAEDADVTLRLWEILRLRMVPERATRVYQMVDRPLVPVIAKMEETGVLVDREELSRLSATFAEEMEKLEQRIHELAGESFSIGSPKQLGEILFGKLGLKGGKKGKSGQYSTDVTVLERLAGDGEPIAQKIVDWRQLSKLKSTYTDALQEQINEKTGRVHTSYSLSGAQTGRLSSTEPNLQNIPIRTAIGRQIRQAFVAAPGHVILAADYSQIELRLAAHIADVETLKEAFANGEDIHNRTARELFGSEDRDARARAKTINFAILYGISRWGLAKRLEVDADEAQAMIDTYFERFPGINQYISTTLQSVRETSYTETLFGRKTWFERIKSPNQAERQGSERAAINAPIQGTSADIIKRAMARMGPALLEAGLNDVKMLMQVHDELVFEVPEADVDAASQVIRSVMSGAAEPAVKLSVPLDVDIGTGKSWDEAH